jgi:hypothetical protein
MRTLVFLAAMALAGCRDDQDPNAARELWDRIHQTDYRALPRAPGYETRQPTQAPHGKQVEIWMNKAVADVLAEKKPLAEWPVGSLIIKDGYGNDGDLDIVAVMEKRADGWFWAEYDGKGDSLYSGKPETCTDCHARGSDFVRAFSLPR